MNLFWWRRRRTVKEIRTIEQVVPEKAEPSFRVYRTTREWAESVEWKRIPTPDDDPRLKPCTAIEHVIIRGIVEFDCPYAPYFILDRKGEEIGHLAVWNN